MTNESNIPQDLKDNGYWCGWKYIKKPGDTKPSKFPVNPKTGTGADSTNKDTFASYTECVFAKSRYNYDGLGIGVFDNLCGIDIDHCVNENGEISDIAVDIATKLHSYTEISPSGTGLRIFIHTTNDFKFDKDKYYIKNSNNGVEIYAAGYTSRFMTVTGNRISNTVDIETRDKELLEVLDKYMQRPRIENIDNKPKKGNIEQLQLGLEKDDKLRELWNGDPSGSGGNESETDMALCSKLNFWLDNDTELVMEAFLSSPYVSKKDDLHKRKLERDDYLLDTINKSKQPITASEKYKELTAKEIDANDLYKPIENIEYSYEPKERSYSEFTALDELVGGFTYDCITLWSSQTNGGKSTLLGQITRNLINQKRKVFYFAGEHSYENLQKILYKQMATEDMLEGVDYSFGDMPEDIKFEYKGKKMKDFYIKKEYIGDIKKFYEGNLFIYNNNAPRDIDTMIKAMIDVNEKYGVRDFVIDNLMQIEMNEDTFKSQTDITEKLRKFAINYKSNVHLVAHPKKTEGNAIRLTLFDVSGSMNITNKSYNLISIIRVDQMNPGSQEYKQLERYCWHKGYELSQVSCVLEVLKQKEGIGTGIVCLKFNPVTRTYSQVMSKGYDLTSEHKSQNSKFEKIQEDK